MNLRLKILLMMFPVLGLAWAQRPDASFITLDENSDALALAAVDTATVVKAPAKIEKLENFEMPEEKVVFVPKGQWVAGLSISYSMSTQNKYQFLILEDLSGDTYSFRVSPMVCYIFKNDMGAGARFAYSRNLTKLEKADFVLDSETNYGVDHLYRLAHNYSGTAIMRNYFALGRSKRIGVFNEVQFTLGGGQSKLMTGTGQTLSGNYERNFSLDVGIAPGLIYFLNDYSAVEVNIGVLGFSYTTTRTLTDQIYESKRDSKSANFRINLFSISFGVAWYL